ncbi:vascular-related unknown protein 1-like [Lotus japonicus]|uniref:Uncharacterized protein n=1 Tax=Lotus japonicus TaxID=34305 RepID=I3SB32_LOTJA|nr:vascular-related unknown protein 1-like [Lotus japonicus]AFK37474.1 unknown [Lotus japonicus]
MEHSLKFSLQKTVSANTRENPSYPEESGWTSYFEDLSEGSDYSSLGGSSLVSDAASCAAWKFSHQNQNRVASSYSPDNKGRDSSNHFKKLCFKKTRTKQISEDDPLEDTASSPVSSPKVRDLNPMEMISRKIDDYQLDDYRVDSEHHPKLKTNDCDLNFNGKKIECTNLKKRGLCLVPMSVLVNHYG